MHLAHLNLWVTRFKCKSYVSWL